jgi:hypothetical protein
MGCDRLKKQSPLDSLEAFAAVQKQPSWSLKTRATKLHGFPPFSELLQSHNSYAKPIASTKLRLHPKTLMLYIRIHLQASDSYTSSSLRFIFKLSSRISCSDNSFKF